MIVVDAGVLATALADDGPDGDQARDALRGQRLAVPDLADLEVAVVWRHGVRTGALDERRAGLALADLAELPLHRVPPHRLLPWCWELTRVLPAGEAPYVALAQALDAELLTADARFAARAAAHCATRTLE